MVETERTSGSKVEGIPRNPRINYTFEKEEFDFFFQWIAGSQTNGGSEVGEILYAADQVKKGGGDEEAWTASWDELGQRVEARGDRSLEGGHDVSARESYLRAYTYYRAPLLFISQPSGRDRGAWSPLSGSTDLFSASLN